MESPFAYTIISTDDGRTVPTLANLRLQLESANEESKILAMKAILLAMLGGEALPGLLMHVIRFVMPAKGKALKKLLVLYWETISKTADGKLRQEMVLVCNALRNDLLHPNEFIRGQMLRFLCKLREEELLEPLVPSIRTNLEHKHPYVRKNAVLAIFSVYKAFNNLVPDAPELISEFLYKVPQRN